MRIHALVALAAAATLVGCARPAPPPPAVTAAAGPGPRSCGFDMLGRSLRPGADLAFVFTVPSGSQWCFDGIGVSGHSMDGLAVVEAPAHGEVRLVPRPGAIVIGYRPAPGFSGDDRFRIAVPSDVTTAYLAGHVTVTAAAP